MLFCATVIENIVNQRTPVDCVTLIPSTTLSPPPPSPLQLLLVFDQSTWVKLIRIRAQCVSVCVSVLLIVQSCIGFRIY